MEFLKLEKVEIGGSKGKMLSQQVAQIFDEFQDLLHSFSEASFDCMDLDDKVISVPVTYQFKSSVILKVTIKFAWLRACRLLLWLGSFSDFEQLHTLI